MLNPGNGTTTTTIVSQGAGGATSLIPGDLSVPTIDAAELIRPLFGSQFAPSADNLAALQGVASGAEFKKLQFGLAELFVESQQRVASLSGAARAAEVEGFESTNPFARIEDGRVAVDFTAVNGDGASLLPELEALGLIRGSAYGAMASGWLPLDKIDDVAALANLNHALPVYAITNVGTVTSQDDRALASDTARSTFGVNGAGNTIGILSDTFNTPGKLTSYPQDIASGDLPAGIRILSDLANGSDEGRGMAQLIYDIAPGVNMAFHTAFNGQADFANGIVRLRNEAGSSIIVDDVFYFAEPFFQDGIVAQAVDQVANAGALYFSSAGNQASQSYESAFRNSGQTINLPGPNGGTYILHDFDPGAGVDTRQSFRVGNGGLISFQWDQPFKSSTPGAAGPGSQSDMAIVVFSTAGTFLFAANEFNIGADPLEILGFSVGGGAIASATLGLALRQGGVEPGLMKYIGFQPIAIDEYNTMSSTVVGHANARGAIAVGAAPWFATPAFGVTPPRAENFSSEGGTPILFEFGGIRLNAPIIRDKVEFTASDGGNTTFFGRDIPEDADTFPNFFGTSAAAPNAAAVAALLKQANPTATNSRIEQTLKDSAIDIVQQVSGTLSAERGIGPGTDRTTGTGLIQADRALTSVLTQTGTTGNDVLTGTPFPDLFLLQQGGSDVVNALGSNDGVYFGAALDPDDQVNGGEGADDQVALRGTYNITLSTGSLISVETLSLLSGADARFEAAGPPASYNITSVNGNVAAGANLTVNGNGLASNEPFTFNGTAETNGTFTFFGGMGAENLRGGSLSDGFLFGEGRFNVATDKVNGTLGTDDQLALRGNYASTLNFLPDTISNIDTVALLSSGVSGAPFNYSLRFADGNVAAGAQLTVTGAGLVIGEGLNADGSAETDGSFRFIGGAFNDVLTGGAGNDVFFGGLGLDSLGGGGGNNTFVYTDTAQSMVATGTGPDQIRNFDGGDLIDLLAIDANTIAAGNQDFTYIFGNTFNGTPGQLRVVDNGGGVFTVFGNTDTDLDAELVITVTTQGGYVINQADFVGLVP